MTNKKPDSAIMQKRHLFYRNEFSASSCMSYGILVIWILLFILFRCISSRFDGIKYQKLYSEAVNCIIEDWLSSRWHVWRPLSNATAITGNQTLGLWILFIFLMEISGNFPTKTFVVKKIVWIICDSIIDFLHLLSVLNLLWTWT